MELNERTKFKVFPHYYKVCVLKSNEEKQM